MSIALIAHDELFFGEVGTRLTDAGATGVYCVTAAELLRGSKSIAGAELVFLIQATQDKLKTGELVGQTRLMMGQGQRLVLCIPRMRDPNFFRALGADDIINPAKPDAQRIAERILGHIILERRIAPYGLDKLLGATPLMRELYRKIEKIAKRKGSALILGETGTGKELIANALHKLSERRGNLIKINCPEMPSDMLSSELFGYEKGSFTGAVSNRVGMIQAAHGGTVFIDEIGELKEEVQIKLLDTVQWGRVRPLGRNETVDVDVRFVFATHKDLPQLIREGRFREDLFERINVHVLESPPLRDRMADIPLLVEHFISRLNMDGTSPALETGAVDELFRHQWPTNVRQLENVIIKAAAKAEADDIITDVMLLESITKSAQRRGNFIEVDPRAETWPQLRDRTEAAYFKALDDIAKSEEEGVNFSGMERSQYHKLRSKHGLGRGKRF
jgi:DNA-binding NtrC family response regulator